MRRIFIAVGSESLKGVTALVHRLCEENLFSQFDDRYIAIDSMSSEVAAFNALGVRLHTDRVKGFTLAGWHTTFPLAASAETGRSQVRRASF